MLRSTTPGPYVSPMTYAPLPTTTMRSGALIAPFNSGQDIADQPVRLLAIRRGRDCVADAVAVTPDRRRDAAFEQCVRNPPLVQARPREYSRKLGEPRECAARRQEDESLPDAGRPRRREPAIVRHLTKGLQDQRIQNVDSR